MANFVIVGVQSSAASESFEIVGDSNVAFKVYSDSLCRNEVSRSTFANPAIIHVTAASKQRVFSKPTQFFIRNESSYPITKIRVQAITPDKPANIAVAPDCSGKPKELRFAGQAVIVFEGKLMPMQVVPFWLCGIKEPKDEEGIYDIFLVIDAETAL